MLQFIVLIVILSCFIGFYESKDESLDIHIYSQLKNIEDQLINIRYFLNNNEHYISLNKFIDNILNPSLKLEYDGEEIVIPNCSIDFMLIQKSGQRCDYTTYDRIYLNDDIEEYTFNNLKLNIFKYNETHLQLNSVESSIDPYHVLYMFDDELHFDSNIVYPIYSQKFTVVLL